MQPFPVPCQDGPRGSLPPNSVNLPPRGPPSLGPGPSSETLWSCSLHPLPPVFYHSFLSIIIPEAVQIDWKENVLFLEQLD